MSLPATSFEETAAQKLADEFAYSVPDRFDLKWVQENLLPHRLSNVQAFEIVRRVEDICYRRRLVAKVNSLPVQSDEYVRAKEVLYDAAPTYSAYHALRSAYDPPLASKPRLMAAVSAEPKPSRWERFKAHHGTLLAYHIGLYLAVASLFFYCAYRVGVIVGGGR